jgi:uncharacterized protein YeaO (DUF488 family)
MEVTPAATAGSGPPVGAIAIARVYDEVGQLDQIDQDTHGPSHRILVDRLWPRGLSKSDAPFDTWAKNVAPSAELRKWYGHAEERFVEFARRYRNELTVAPAAEALAELRAQVGTDDVVLLTATKDLASSHATVLRDLLGRA